jgi:hypothetical protein
MQGTGQGTAQGQGRLKEAGSPNTKLPRASQNLQWAEAESMPVAPDSLWNILTQETRNRVKDYLISISNGISLYRALCELGYRDFFGLCLGLVACYNYREVGEGCGRLILNKYMKNTGSGESSYDWRLRDPMPSFDFAQRVFGPDLCVDQQMVDSISMLIDIISSDACKADEKYCREVKNFQSLKNMRTKTIITTDRDTPVVI